tara:strand:+ start:46439 stop:46837 length:399 start_codon:yes stop_codon:yes gene_type:complete
MSLDVQMESVEDFYQVYSDWCTAHDFPTLNINNIESIFVCYNEGIPIYACPFWSTASQMCMIGYIVSNPSPPYKGFKKGGLDYLMKGVAGYAKESGYGIMWTTSSTKRIIDSLESTGFKVGDKNINEYAKFL